MWLTSWQMYDVCCVKAWERTTPVSREWKVEKVTGIIVCCDDADTTFFYDCYGDDRDIHVEDRRQRQMDIRDR